ncbi:sugar phosphate isomerase/epimerase family protein [Chthonomonas calidirosea]|uniref:sugar phosphate isomerase/epimerase family protein n=1 Tax=Chthonomonas calidirosea TaxID=454171 RepID=UPI0006EC836A|nr:TIM barrel protein [Chthonomonas calidirosea]CEK18265.1 xylose isomerase-like enzyme [Chthonomonas calidirosea]
MGDHQNIVVDIGINGAFLTRRWEEPENWMRLTRECGFAAHSFCADVIDPFFSGDRPFQLEQARATREAAARYGITICDLYTGVATHRFHGLSHSDPRPRQRMKEWIEAAAEIAVTLGTDLLGGHWDAFSCEVLADPLRTREATNRLHQTFRELAQKLRASGLRALMQEQMYIPSEKPWTLEEGERFLLEVNRDRGDALPVLLTLDVGHQAGMHYGLAGPDLDYTEWIRRFGATCAVIHLQQTTPDASHHWPFTEEYNRRGHIRMEKVLEALQRSHAEYEQSPLAQVLPRATKQWLVAEIIPGSTKTEAQLLKELEETARFLRGYVPEGGLVM